MKKRLERAYRIGRYIVYKETLVDPREHVLAFLGAFLGIGLIGYLQSLMLTRLENIFLIGSFGASSVLIYGAIHSPFSQPRNLIGGHVISALVGVTLYQLIPHDLLWFGAALAVAFSIIAMQATKTLHPPGGATALIAVMGTEKVKALGYWYVVSPVLSGVLILFVIALAINNTTKNRKYPSEGRFLQFMEWISEPVVQHKKRRHEKRNNHTNRHRKAGQPFL